MKMRKLKRIFASLIEVGEDEKFLQIIHTVENIVAKVLSLTLLVVIIVALFDLIIFLFDELLTHPVGFFNTTLIEIFGLFLNILIALELLENVSAYLRKHIFHVELVIATSLIAVARKIIIFDFKTYSSSDLIALSLGIFALSLSYWLVRRMNPN